MEKSSSVYLSHRVVSGNWVNLKKISLVHKIHGPKELIHNYLSYDKKIIPSNVNDQ